jgi:hypothetical protein
MTSSRDIIQATAVSDIGSSFPIFLLDDTSGVISLGSRTSMASLSFADREDHELLH